MARGRWASLLFLFLAGTCGATIVLWGGRGAAEMSVREAVAVLEAERDPGRRAAAAFALHRNADAAVRRLLALGGEDGEVGQHARDALGKMRELLR